jgi:hypothetical protein
MLALTACGKKTHQAARETKAVETVAATAAGACDILTEDVAKKYLGSGATLRRKAQPNPRMTQCQWASENGAISVMTGPWGMVYTGTSQDQSVTGLGDEAHIGPTGLFVRKGDRGLDINVIVQGGEFWGSAADDITARTAKAEKKVAPDLVAKL